MSRRDLEEPEGQAKPQCPERPVIGLQAATEGKALEEAWSLAPEPASASFRRYQKWDVSGILMAGRSSDLLPGKPAFNCSPELYLQIHAKRVELVFAP